ncbi:MAG: transcription-repair coupling factor [Desulfuromonadaceae bacterium]|nr:transcription-repair coupling factor [Desulfuromonadaceae bacterium]
MTRQEHAHTTLTSFSEALSAFSGRAEILGLKGSAGARFVAALAATSRPPLLVVAASQEQARCFFQELCFFAPRPDAVRLFPHWEVPPYEPLNPHSDIEAQRLATLQALHQQQVEVVVTTVAAVLQRVIPRSALAALSSELVAGEEYERQALQQRLFQLGYRAVPLVEDRGTFSLRGDILDLYPPTLAQPVRIDFYGDFVERMRLFDPQSQRSGEQQLERLQLLPSRELVLAGEYLERFNHQLKLRCDALGLPRTRREEVLDEVREGLLSPGRSFLLPLNYEKLDTLFDYVQPRLLFRLEPQELEQEIDRFCQAVRKGVERQRQSSEPWVEPGQLYVCSDELESRFTLLGCVDLNSLPLYDLEDQRPVFRVQCHSNAMFLQAAAEERLDLLARQLQQWQQEGWTVQLACRQDGQARRMRELLLPRGITPQQGGVFRLGHKAKGGLFLCLGEISRGFQLPDERLALVCEEEIFGPRQRRRGRSEARAKAVLSSLAQLQEGDYVVHTDHGIALYRGLQHVCSGQLEGDFLQLEYAGGDKLYVPVERIEKVQKYAGGDGQGVRLDKMGGNAWEKTCQKARAAVEEMARELLNIYARRQMNKALPFSPPDEVFRAFEAEFPYEETPDQMAAIQDVLNDMQSETPMDRLICGDVGYGKTEVAIRAAFKAALDSRQVAVVVPTTILASQHYATFRERLKEYPVRVEMVSRFRSAAQQKKILAEVAAGTVDIVIGTHRLLQRDVHFKDLGLVVIDEEQRFGVAHKERLKKMRAQVAMLTLSATPIPRTLNMGMLGMRDLSIIDTPPVDRLAIRTYVTKFDDDLVRQAILRELQRGGQVYFVHNRVQSIGAMADFLRSLVPEATLAVGHGQMPEKELEQVLLDFVEGRTQVLVASTIIENGLDIPRANTIIINRADCFGLAQLYQLRGRVGRAKERGYAYLLIPGEATLTREARARLQVLQDLTELGAGFRVASYDLELRGAGDLIGGRQAGHMASIGFEMYTELLEDTIQELRGAHSQGRIDPEIRLGLNAFLPDRYVADPNQRLVFYKRMAAAVDEMELYDLVDELQDRYGALPAAGETLLEMMKLRVRLKRLRIDLAEYDGRALVFGFHPTTGVEPDKLLALIQQDGKRYSLSPDFRLRMVLKREDDQQLMEEANRLLAQLS